MLIIIDALVQCIGETNPNPWCIFIKMLSGDYLYCNIEEIMINSNALMFYTTFITLEFKFLMVSCQKFK